MSRTFPIAVVLTVATDLLLCHMDDLYEVLNYLTDDNIYTHQIPRALRVCGPAVLAQHPDLAAITVPDTLDGAEAVNEWLDGITAGYGTERELTPVSEWQHVHPVEDLCDLMGPERVWVYPG